METETAGAAVILTLALALLEASATLWAVTDTDEGEGTEDGAVYRPVEEMVPTFESPPTVPLTSQETAVLLVLLTAAENC